MRFLYVAPRYHTNQIPIMKGLKAAGNEVCFVSQYRGNIEDYTCITPIVAGYSKIFLIINYLYIKTFGRKNSKAGNMKLKCGFPPFGRIKNIVKKFQPDVIIIRERSIYSVFTFLSCKRLGIPMILYNQSPLWETEIKKDLPHYIIKKMLPYIRITPVMGTEKINYVKEDGAYFVPFVMEPGMSPEKKVWFKNEKINILCIGKYEKRKNIHMLLEIFANLSIKEKLELTIVGECADDFQKQYKKKLETFIEENCLSSNVKLLENIAHTQVEDLYADTDLFVIPSTKEPASISQLEAMAFSIPVICSDTNGTSCYIREGVNGYLFKDNSKTDLQKVIEKCLDSKENLKVMGKNSYEEIEKKCCFDLYYKKICECIEETKKYYGLIY